MPAMLCCANEWKRFMTKQKPILLLFFLLILPILPVIIPLPEVAAGEDGSSGMIVTDIGQRYTETIPIFDVRDFGHPPITLPIDEPINETQTPAPHSQFARGGGSDPANPYAIICKTGLAYLAPGATAVYEVTLSNYESISHTFRLTDSLPAQLAYIPNLESELSYDPSTRTLSWEGDLAPGHLDYIIESGSFSLPYLDLADFGAINLCEDFIANGEACQDAAVTFNLGVNGYSTNLYDEPLSQLTVSANGLILGNDSSANGRNQWLPDTAEPNFVIAGLWREANATQYGRWHAAILSGLVEGYDVFYTQWHNIPHANDPELTARHAIAILLNRDDSLANGLAGHIFFIYDNISDPAQLVEQGYTIGIEDKLGLRGATYAYAPCCGDTLPAQGYPPETGTTLHLRPVLFGADNPYQRTFRYEATVAGQIPETIVNTAVVSSSSANAALAEGWASHYLYVRRLTYLPFIQGEGSHP